MSTPIIVDYIYMIILTPYSPPRGGKCACRLQKGRTHGINTHMET